jgi:hypothetical protein
LAQFASKLPAQTPKLRSKIIKKYVDARWRFCESDTAHGKRTTTTHYRNMKKTLLMAAAALAAGIISSQAQPVYSQNVVGYINVVCPANQFKLIGNQLDTGTNTLNNVLNSGLVSNGGSGGTTVSIWNGAGFTTWYYYSPADTAPAPGGWYDGSGTIYSTNHLDLSKAVFIRNFASTNITVTLVGTVSQGTNNYTVTPGLNFYSQPIPLGGTSLDNTNVNFPATSSLDTYQVWTGTGYGPQYTYYNSLDSGGAPGWYDASGTVNESTNAAAWPSVGQGFLVNHHGSTSNWVNTFLVQ